MQNRPNSYLYQSLAVLAADVGAVEEARRWLIQGTSTLQVGSLRARHDCVQASSLVGNDLHCVLGKCRELPAMRYGRHGP